MDEGSGFFTDYDARELARGLQGRGHNFTLTGGKVGKAVSLIPQRLVFLLIEWVTSEEPRT
jgi:hypothetical protein